MKAPARPCSIVWRKSIVCLALGGLFWIAGVSKVQAEVNRNETDSVRQETMASQQAVQTAEASQQQTLQDGRVIHFSDILKDPDNIELNFLYAKQQVRENNVLGAAATLERILLIQPNLAPVRLFYAIVLFRLDNLNEAGQELEKLKSLSMPDSLRNEMNQYLKLIRLRRKRTVFGLRESIGYQFDTNRNAAPSSKYRLAGEIPLGLTGTDRKRDDTSFLNITTIDVTHDLGMQAGHELNASFTYFLQEQTMVDSLDLSSFQYSFGGTYKSRWFYFSPSFNVSHLFLSREGFLRTQGGSFNLSHEFFRKLNVFSEFKIERDDYSGISENTTADERDGRLWELELGATYKLTQTMRWTNSFIYDNQTAKQGYNAYERIGLRGSHTWLLGRGQFLINAIDLMYDQYDEPDTTIAGRFRRDKSLRYRVTYGAPLDFLLIGKILPGPFKDITLTLSYEYYRSLSTITNYTYTNNKFQTLLTKRWEF
ncbi:MAG: DUF2860 family protein [Candidatus Omnitrophica bacterium]|nr:DUF2860 family protein [Candidatus Omnitrophota bacterium]